MLREVLTIDESINQRIEKAKKWQEANPGLSYFDDWHPQDEPKIYITKDLLRSPAYRSLSRSAMLVYQDFLEKRILKPLKQNKKKYWVIENNGSIIYPYSEAVENGFSKTAFRNAIDELQSKGLIDINHRGKGGRKPARGTGDVTTYLIDDRWKEYGTEDFRPPRKPRRKDMRRGRGFAAIWNDPQKAKAMLQKRSRTITKKKKQSSV